MAILTSRQAKRSKQEEITMPIPELTEEQRIESFMKERLRNFDDKVELKKNELAKFCLKEIDYAIDMVNQVDMQDIEDQVIDD